MEKDNAISENVANTQSTVLSAEHRSRKKTFLREDFNYTVENKNTSFD